VRCHEPFLELEGLQAGFEVSFSSDCMLCCTVVRKEQRTCIVVDTSRLKSVVGLGDRGPHHCSALSEAEAQTVV